MKRSILRGTTLALAIASAVTVVEVASMPAAHAAAPLVVAFLPPVGPVGTSVTITGTGFQDSSTATSVAFNGTLASFTVDSDLQITATVPAGATTGTIAVTDGEGAGTSLLPFTVTPSPPPLIVLFSPLSGSVGTDVTITGTGFTGASAVSIGGTAATFDVNSDLEIEATVPSGAMTGPISVTTPGGVASSLVDFTVTPTAHSRHVSLHLRRALLASGHVNTGDAFGSCESNVTVMIQRRRHGNWRRVERDVTNPNGRYRAHMPDRPGKYRAVAKRKVILGLDVCPRAVSRLRTHS